MRLTAWSGTGKLFPIVKDTFRVKSPHYSLTRGEISCATPRHATPRHATPYAILLLCATLGCEGPSDSPSAAAPTNEALAAPDELVEEGDYIRTVAHGAYLNQDNQAVTPTRELIMATQARHLDYLLDYALEHDIELAPHEPVHDDPVLDGARQIRDLVEQLRPPREPWIVQINGSTSQFYAREIAKMPPEQIELLLPPSNAVELPAGDWSSVQALITSESGGAYVEQCIIEGVPVPDVVQLNKFASVFTAAKGVRAPKDQWVNWGYVEKANPQNNSDLEMIIPGGKAQLWSYEMDSPRGVCLALPRWTQGTTAGLVGVICLGMDTSKVCYFDKDDIATGTSHSMQSFRGGQTLYAGGTNPGGICSDCHAGSNPFIVHPEYPPFEKLKDSGLTLTSPQWPEPIVPTSWPENPGPLVGLGTVLTGELECTTCHTSSPTAPNYQFPAVSNQLPGYCGTVLRAALGQSPFFGNTDFQSMPYLVPGDYSTHMERLLRDLCTQPPNNGTPTGDVPDDDESVLSAPIVVEPLYECATVVGVRGARLNAEVTLFVEGNDVGTKIVRDPNGLSFELSTPLVEDEEVWAVQTFNGQSSLTPMVPAKVRLYQDDYPNGVPEPSIEPSLVHECASSVAVRKMPGASVSLYINDVPDSTSGPNPWRHVVKSSTVPFIKGQKVTATQTFCGEESDPSTPRPVVAAPSSLPPLNLANAPLFYGQDLMQIDSIVYGARLEVEEANAGIIKSVSSWPTSFYEFNLTDSGLGRPAEFADTFMLRQELCGVLSPPLVIGSVQSCEEAPAPAIETPFDGDDFVTVKQAIPGATIRVWADDAGEEIGDGAGQLISLTRPLVFNELLLVTQQLDDCVAGSAYSIRVQ